MSQYLSTTKTLGDISSHVKRQFGDEANIQISTSDIARWANAGQVEIFRLKEPIKSKVNADLVSGTRVYSFPANVLRVQSIYLNGRLLQQMSVQAAEEYILENDPTGTTVGEPQIWWEWAGQFTLWPTPNTSVTSGITFNYIKEPTVVVADTDLLSIPDVYYNRLLEYVLQQAYELDENFNAANTKAAQFSQNLDTYGKDNEIANNVYPMITVLDEDAF